MYEYFMNVSIGVKNKNSGYKFHAMLALEF